MSFIVKGKGGNVEFENSLNNFCLWSLKAQFIGRAAAVSNQIGRIKFGSSTVTARHMNRA